MNLLVKTFYQIPQNPSQLEEYYDFDWFKQLGPYGDYLNLYINGEMLD